MNILIVEDESLTATYLKMILEEKGYQVLALCKNFKEVKEVLLTEVPDLLLCDIRLKNSPLDGIAIAAYVQSQYTIPVIYLTSHTDATTYENAKLTKPAAYLFKPFRKEELAIQIELALSHYHVNRTATSPNPNEEERIFFPTGRGHQKIYKRSIQFIKADGAYVHIYVVDRDAPLMLSMNLGYIEQFFTASNFYKVSRSFIINIDYVKSFDTEYIYIEESNEKVPIPKSKRQGFLNRFSLVKTPQRRKNNPE